jgi:hypothetical protein
MAASSETKVITPEAVLSYPNLLKAQQANGQGKAKFSATFVFPGGRETTKALAQAAVAAARDKWGAKADDMIKSGEINIYGGKGASIRTDAAAKKYTGDRFPEGTVFVNARSDNRPGLVFAHKDPVTGKAATVAEDEIVESFYAGSRVRASLTAFAYDNSGNKGVAFGLNNIQLIGAGPRLDSRTKAEDDFEALSDAPADLSDLGI